MKIYTIPQQNENTVTVELVKARGHKNVSALHSSTFEITRDPEISTSADCIIAVCADKAAASLSDEFKISATREDSVIIATITSGDHTETIHGWGSPKMTFTDPASMVFRVSDFVCGRTVMINADRSASRLNRGLIGEIASGKDTLITLRIERGERPKPSLDLLFED